MCVHIKCMQSDTTLSIKYKPCKPYKPHSPLSMSSNYARNEIDKWLREWPLLSNARAMRWIAIPLPMSSLR